MMARLKRRAWLSAGNLALGILLLWAGWHLFDWAVLQAVFLPDASACHALEGAGACWGVVAEKYRVIFFGRYPLEEQWRPLLAIFVMLGLLGASAIRRRRGRRLALLWASGLTVFLLLLKGGLFGLANVDTPRWGGLPLTLMLTVFGLGGAFPLAVLLALGRVGRWAALRALCTVFIEIVRGVPLVAVLFMAAFLFPLLMPKGWDIPSLLRVLVGIILFAGAYMAEVIRGGLLAVPKGQAEAAQSLGLSYWHVQLSVILPQALRKVLPALMNSAIALFKDTSLVIIVGLFELTGALGLAVDGDPKWRAFALDGYLFIAIIYWIGCFAMSRYSRALERTT
ncbi:MAG: amino acid ABC transporter permease [Rhodocyclaceae bacterium]|nr:amino acid ABC transporter permease [Rhodocyclaceae bacterium]